MPTDPRGLRADAPLLDAWLRFHEQELTPFTIPGHKYDLGLLGDVVAGDVPLYGGLASVKDAAALLAAAEDRAAALWGVDRCRFSVAGSTHGNLATALAVASPGQRVIVGRTLHRSLLVGLVLAGLEPVWVRPEVDPRLGVPLGLAPAALEEAFSRAPDAAAVLVGDPSYVGTTGDVAGLAEVAHRHDVPLVVDAAWAAYFGFHPSLPRHALAAGADMLVTSAHKTLPAWSQGALVLARTDRVDPARLDAAFDIAHTTSPSGTILASIDASRALLERDGPEVLAPILEAVAGLRARLTAEVPGLVVLDGPGVDPMKLTLVLSGTGADGNAVERDLIAAGSPLEMADRDTLVPIVSLADGAASLAGLGDLLVRLLERHRADPRPVVGAAAWSLVPELTVPPREAFFAPREAVPLAAAVGRVSAELVAPYPPGVPVLAPGERVTGSVLAALEAAKVSGVRIAYAADPTLATVLVVG
ncbi:aminotransferase class I/II-fold pyridoxal phosphate-dependent enzyme [Nocardioides sp.]|uniref:aminotransferase class I/II-fold pyridoxal phosphate-dependent enzyme n=1 Tax=Nocardioides sp. TaxID=35761 RepID=UPI003526CC67